MDVAVFGSSHGLCRRLIPSATLSVVGGSRQGKMMVVERSLAYWALNHGLAGFYYYSYYLPFRSSLVP